MTAADEVKLKRIRLRQIQSNYHSSVNCYRGNTVVSLNKNKLKLIELLHLTCYLDVRAHII